MAILGLDACGPDQPPQPVSCRPVAQAERLWRDANLYEIGAGTPETRRMLIGRELFNETT